MYWWCKREVCGDVKVEEEASGKPCPVFVMLRIVDWIIVIESLDQGRRVPSKHILKSSAEVNSGGGGV